LASTSAALNFPSMTTRTPALVPRDPPVTDPAAITSSCDARAQRIAAAIKRAVDSAPPLSQEQIEQLRGLLPHPSPGGTSTAA
jgi:hypothetical protein